jgi:hypothetical protein
VRKVKNREWPKFFDLLKTPDMPDRYMAIHHPVMGEPLVHFLTLQELADRFNDAAASKDQRQREADWLHSAKGRKFGQDGGR